jgi:hypothetical protein
VGARLPGRLRLVDDFLAAGLLASALGTRNAEHDHLMSDRVGGVSQRGLDVAARIAHGGLAL